MSEKNSEKRTVRPLDVLVTVKDEEGNRVTGAQVEIVIATRDPRAYLEAFRAHAGQPGVVELSIPCQNKS